MIKINHSARKQVRAYFKDKEIQPVRIFLNTGGCGSPNLAMALDQVHENDAVFTLDGIDYIMDKKLLRQASPVEVDYSGMGFRLTSSLALSGGCSSCGSDSGSCCGK